MPAACTVFRNWFKLTTLWSYSTVTRLITGSIEANSTPVSAFKDRETLRTSCGAAFLIMMRTMDIRTPPDVSMGCQEVFYSMFAIVFLISLTNDFFDHNLNKADLLLQYKGLLACIIHLNPHCGTLVEHPLNLLMQQLVFQKVIELPLEELGNFVEALLVRQL